MASSQKQRRKNLTCCLYRNGLHIRALQEACKAGHVTCVEACVKERMDVSDWYDDGSSIIPRPLVLSIHHRNDDCVEALIRARARIWTEEIEAVGKKGSERCVNLILEAGGDAEGILGYAAYAGRCNVVDLLIKAGTDVNKYGSFVLAAASGSVEIVNQLMHAGADVNRTLRTEQYDHYNLCLFKGTTALLAAAKTKSLEIVNLLLKSGADVNMSSDYGDTALFGAASSNSSQCVACLLSAGADVNIRDSKGNTALFDGIRNGLDKCVNLLLEAGADVNIQDVFGEPALFDGVSKGFPECVDLLLKAGADVNITDEEGKTALFDGVRKGSVKCIVLLLKAGADVNVTDDEGNTVLHQTMSSLTGIKKVLQAGIKINVRNNHGLNALTHLLLNFGKNHSCGRENFRKMWRTVRGEKFAKLLFAAGETVDETNVETVPDYLRQPEDMNLMNICRAAIRKHLMQMDHVSLIYKIQRLGLPNLITSYLLYDVKVDEEEET